VGKVDFRPGYARICNRTVDLRAGTLDLRVVTVDLRVGTLDL